MHTQIPTISEENSRAALKILGAVNQIARHSDLAAQFDAPLHFALILRYQLICPAALIDNIQEYPEYQVAPESIRLTLYGSMENEGFVHFIAEEQDKKRGMWTRYRERVHFHIYF